MLLLWLVFFAAVPMAKGAVPCQSMKGYLHIRVAVGAPDIGQRWTGAPIVSVCRPRHCLSATHSISRVHDGTYYHAYDIWSTEPVSEVQVKPPRVAWWYFWRSAYTTTITSIVVKSVQEEPEAATFEEFPTKGWRINRKQCDESRLLKFILGSRIVEKISLKRCSIPPEQDNPQSYVCAR